MNKTTLTIIFLLTISTPLAFSELNPTKIVEECEKIYPELESLGKTKFQERYMYHPNLRICFSLYNDVSWLSKDPARIDRLIALLIESISNKAIRDRNIQTDIIPQWIKDDATRWHQGKEHDNVFSYGIRFLINSKVITPPNDLSVMSKCQSDRICISDDTYIRYSRSNNQNENTILTHRFETRTDSILINSVEITKEKITRNNFHTDFDGLDRQTNHHYQFIHNIPIRVGSSIPSEYMVTATNEVVFPFKNQQRNAVIAWDKTMQYQEVIDKNTGIVLFAKFHDRIKKTQWIVQLTDTNAFSQEFEIQYEQMNIPTWIKQPVRWWTEGKISDSEYINSISYLLKNKILEI